MIVSYYRGKNDIRTIDVLKGSALEPLQVVRKGITYDRVFQPTEGSADRCPKCAFAAWAACAPGHAYSKGSTVYTCDESDGDDDLVVEPIGDVPTYHYWVEYRNNLVQRINVVEVEI